VHRRDVLLWMGACAVPWVTRAEAQGSSLPLKSPGLEHLGITVPDPEASARFYGRIFDPQLFQERDPPPRFYVRLGTAYLAFGGNKTSTPAIDHFCALVENYRPAELRKSLQSAGVSLGAGALGMATDPDALRLQFLAVPGGLARTIIPASRISQDDAVMQAIGTDHVMLRGSNLERSVEHYRKIFGKEVSRDRKPASAWFGVGRTRLGLEAAASGEKPGIHHICVRVADFNKKRMTEGLTAAGAQIVRSDEKDVLSFRDPHGLVTEIREG